MSSTNNNIFNQTFDNEYTEIQNIIKKTPENIDGNKEVEFLSLIESNDSFIVTVEGFNQGVEYSIDLNNIEYSDLNNTFKRLSQDFKFVKLMHDTVSLDAANFKDLTTLIESAVLDKKQNIFENSYSKKILEYYNENSNITDFGFTTKNFLNKFNNISYNNIQKQSKPSFQILLNSSQDNENDYDDVNSLITQEFFHSRGRSSTVLKEALLVDYSNLSIQDDEKSFTKLTKETNSDSIVQSFINFSRSLYTMSHKSYLFNSSPAYNIQHQYLDYSLENLDLINLIPDFYSYGNNGLNIFNYINTKNKSFNYKSYFRKNKIQNYSSNKSIIQTPNNITNDFNKNSSMVYFIPSSILNSFVTNQMVNSMSLRLVYPQDKIDSAQSNIKNFGRAVQGVNNTGNQNIIPPWYKNYGFKILNEFNKCLTGSFFDVNLDNACKSKKDLNVWIFFFNSLYKNSLSLQKVTDNASPHNLSSSALLFYNAGVMGDSDARPNFETVKAKIENSGNESLMNPDDVRPGFVYNYFNFKDQGQIYLKDQPIVNYDGLQTSNNESFSLDYNTDFKEIDFKQEIDLLIKKTKLKILENKNISTKIFDEIIENIKNSDNNSILLSYCDTDVDKKSVINKNNELFKLMFTEDTSETDNVGNNFYSHIDLLGDLKIAGKKYLGYSELKNENKEVNKEEKKIKENLVKFIENYYSDNIFFSSTTFFDFVMSSIVNDKTYFNLNLGDVIQSRKSYDFTDVLNCQALYFNYILSEDSNENALEIIIKRFIEKAIQVDNVSSDIIKNSLNNKFYSYDNSSVSIDDYDDGNKESLIQYQKDIIDTSDNLKIIKNSVFSLDNIKDLSSSSQYKFISNVRTVDYGNTTSNVENNINNSNRAARVENIFNSLTQPENNSIINKKFGITANIACNFYPGHMLFYGFRSFSRFDKDGEVIYEKTIHNKIKSVPNTDNKKFFIDKERNFNIEKERNIKLKLSAYLCKGDNQRFKDHVKNLSSILIEDIFDYTSCNEKTIFNKIIQTIQLYLRQVLPDYSSNEFNSFEEIKKYVESNKSIYSEILIIVKTFAKIFLPVFYRHQRHSCIQVFKSLPVENLQEDDLPYICGGKNMNSFIFGRVGKHNNIDLSVLRFYNKRKHFNFTLSGQDLYNKLIADIIRVRNNFLQNNLDISDIKLHQDGYLLDTQTTHFLDNEIDTKDIWITPFSNQLRVVYNSLYKSDLIQVLNLDVIIGYLRTQEKIISGDISETFTSSFFESIKNKTNEKFTKSIEKNFYKDVYMHLFIKKAKNAENRSKSTLNIINSTLENNENLGIYQNLNIFDNNKIFINQKLNNLNSTSSQENGLDYIFNSNSDSQNKLLNKNILSLGLHKDIIKNKSSDFIVKVEVNIVDIENLNHIYVPKIYLFSSSISSGNDVLKDEESYSSNSLIYYDKTFNTKNMKSRIVEFNIEDKYLPIETIGNTNDILDLSTDRGDFLFHQLNNISKYYNNVYDTITKTDGNTISSLQTYSYLNNHILNSHLMTKYLENSSFPLTNYNVPNLDKINVYNRSYVDIVNQIDKKDFLKEFNIEKSKFINSLSFNQEREFFEIVDDNSNTKAVNFLNNIQSLTNKNILHDNDEYFSIYHISVDPNDMNYFIIDESAIDYNNDLLVDISDLDNIFINSFMKDKYDQLRSINDCGHYYYRSRKKVKNYKIIIKTEVL